MKENKTWSVIFSKRNPRFFKFLKFGKSLLLILFFFPTLSKSEIFQKSFSFYSEQITIRFDEKMVVSMRVIPGEYGNNNQKSSIQLFYEKIEKSDYQILLNDLFSYKEKFELNDWLFYELIKVSVGEIYEGRPTIHKRLAIWALTAKAGYDTRITYLAGEVFLNAFTTEEVYEVPMILEMDKTFINLTEIHAKTNSAKVLYISDFAPNPNGKPFSFGIEKLPKLKPKFNSRFIRFEGRKSLYEFNIKYDRTIIDLMRNYPFIAENQYVLAPFSPTLSESILPVMRDILEEKTVTEALEILVAFTRSGFAYKTDEEVYGKSKPMIPEEVFYYQFSDCEDRSALFFNLVKELLGLPVIVIAYHDHVTVGVASELPVGAGEFLYCDGKRYYVCDPTGPTDSIEVGRFPDGYKALDFEVIARQD